jgi:hypothetical protein
VKSPKLVNGHRIKIAFHSFNSAWFHHYHRLLIRTGRIDRRNTGGIGSPSRRSLHQKQSHRMQR